MGLRMLNIGDMEIDDLVITGGDYLDGKIDEVRISDTARDACWIETEYNNQDAPTTFYSISAELGARRPRPWTW